MVLSAPRARRRLHGTGGQVLFNGQRPDCQRLSRRLLLFVRCAGTAVVRGHQRHRDAGPPVGMDGGAAPDQRLARAQRRPPVLGCHDPRPLLLRLHEHLQDLLLAGLVGLSHLPSRTRGRHDDPRSTGNLSSWTSVCRRVRMRRRNRHGHVVGRNVSSRPDPSCPDHAARATALPSGRLAFVQAWCVSAAGGIVLGTAVLFTSPGSRNRRAHNHAGAMFTPSRSRHRCGGTCTFF